MPMQLAFDLPVLTALGRDDFFVSPANQFAVAILDAPFRWPDRKMVLAGPEGSGKSHLAHIWAATRDAAIVAADRLAAQPPGHHSAIVVEDADRIAGDNAAETALFHLHNLVLADGGLILITARTSPGRWGIRLPDLASRLQATSIATLEPPDDALLAAVLIKLFADRQLAVSGDLIGWLVTHMDRSFVAARRLVGVLDATALARRRPISIKMATEVLDSLGQDTQ